jgi:hypothetical protein
MTKPVLNKKETKKLEKEKLVVQSGDLYKALHFVGDDPVKAEIEDVLEDLLDEETMRTIRAVFNLSTGWKDL